MRIHHNLSALIAGMGLKKTQKAAEKSLERLSSGLRINSAADDASGLAVSEKMRSQIRGLDQAVRNAQDGISLLQTAEGGLNGIHSILQRMRELSVQAANDTLTAGDRGQIQLEIDELTRQIDAIASQTQFNRKKLLNGDVAVLWSTSTRDIDVVVSGTLQTKDLLGNVRSAAGNYKLTFNAVSEGRENIQKSNIFYLKHGTRQSQVAIDGRSGLTAVTALNMVEGVWSLETRETPFGGIRYYVGNADSDPAGVGASLSVSPTPNIVSPGTYDLRFSDVVPMMADFDAALAAGVVEGVNMSSRGASSDFDARFDIGADLAGAPSASLVYRNDVSGGGSVSATGAAADVSLATNGANGVNLFTHYAVTGTDRRDLMAGDVTLTESYVTHHSAVMTVNLDYRAADDTTAVISYRTSSAGNTVTAVSNYQAAAGATLDIGGTVIAIGGMNMDEIAAAVNGESPTTGVTASLVVIGGQGRLQLFNGSGSDVTVTENGVGPVGLGLAGTAGAGDSLIGANRDYNRSTTVAVNGQDLAGLASVLDGMTGISASLVGGGPTQISLTGEANYHVVLSAAGNVNGELVLNRTFDGGGSHLSAQVWHNHSLTAATAGQDLATMASTLQNSLGAAFGMAGGGSFSVSTTTAGGLHGLSLANSSFYQVSLTGTAMNELRTGSYVSGTSTLARGASLATGNRVYVNHDVTVATADADALAVASALNTAVNGALAGDALVNNNGLNPFSIVSAGDTRQLRLSSAAASGYRMAVTAGTDGSLAEVWGGAAEAARGGASVDGQVLDHNRQTTFNVAGLNMEEAFAALDGDGRMALTWTTEPDHGAGTHQGRLLIENVSSGAGRRRLSLTQAGTDQGNGTDALRKLFEATGAFYSAENSGVHTVSSQTLQAHDSLTVQMTWDGNRASDGSRYNGTASAQLWEGGAAGGGTSDQNASALSAALGLAGFFTSFVVADGDPHGSDLAANDSWMTFTSANVAGTRDTLGLTLYDGLYADGGNNNGVTTGITYAFNDGVLDGRSLAINQLVRTGAGIGGSASLAHNVDFGSVGSSTSFTYGERRDAGAYWDNTASVPSWYSHAYYGGDSTYYFGSGAAADDVVRQAEVYRQNDINASLMFEYDNGILSVRAKGFGRDGVELASSHDETPYELTAAQFAQLAAGADVTLHGIRFTNLQVDTGRLSAGDKFVINVAAAAKLDGLNGTPAVAGAFQSTANIAVDGDPFRQRRDGEWGALGQYRLAEGAENGRTLNLLGYYIDPLNGSSDIPGLGYYNGTLIVQVGGGGFAAGSTVGEPDGTGASSHRIRAEINYQGDTRPSAGALVTSAFFDRMEKGESSDLKDFIGGIGHANYRYGMRGDGTYGPLNEAGSETYSKLNGSLIFDVVEVVADSLRFRVQGHVIDRDGNQWYVEEESFGLNTTANTSKDSSVQPPVIPAEVTDPVVLFRDAAFGGLFFDEFTLGATENWAVGDRFTLSMTASGFIDGLSESEQQTNPAAAPDTDEINLFSDNRGTNMPHTFRFNEGVLDHSRVDLGLYQLASNLAKPNSDHFHRDQVMDGRLSLSFGDYHPDLDDTVDESLTFEVVYERGMDAGVAHYYSRLEDIAQFHDGNGRFLLDDFAEQLTIRSGDRETAVGLGSRDEIGRLAEAISERIWLDLLLQSDGRLRGEGDTVPYGYRPGLLDRKDRNRILQFVNSVPGSSGNESVVGTFLAHSVLPGADSQLKFFGSEELLKALGFATIQEASNARFRVSVSDAHSGRTVSGGTAVEAGSRAHGLIADGIALDIAGDIGLDSVRYNALSGTFRAGTEATFHRHVHLVDTAAKLQIGANEKEEATLTLGDMRAKALDVDNLDVRKRESAARSITRLDSAIGRVSTQRALIGAQINRLDHTIANLSTTSVNLTASRSRIVDADMAREMMNFTKVNILLQAGASVAAQANQLPQAILQLLNRS